MFFLDRLFGRRRDRRRGVFRYSDGARERRADVVAVGRRLEKECPDFAALLDAVRQDPKALPLGPLRDNAARELTAATYRLAAVARAVFELPPVHDAGGVTEGEALGVLTKYILFMEDLATSASFTSTAPAPA